MDLLVHQRLDFVRAGVADDDDAAVVADEMRQVVVLEDGGKRLEEGRFLGIVDVRLDLVARLGAKLAHDGVQNAERFQILLLLRNGVLQRLDETLAGILHGLHRVGDDEDAEGGSADDHRLPRLDQHLDVAAHGHEATEHATERDDEADDDSQGTPMRSSPAMGTGTNRALCEA